MAWEQRNGSRYFYRSVRERDGKVRKVYGGARLEGAAEERRMIEAAQKRQQDAAAALERETQLAHLDQLMDELEAGTNHIYEEELHAHGFHNHKGQWRRRRER
jgi:hypothetical protein